MQDREGLRGDSRGACGWQRFLAGLSRRCCVRTDAVTTALIGLSSHENLLSYRKLNGIVDTVSFDRTKKASRQRMASAGSGGLES